MKLKYRLLFAVLLFAVAPIRVQANIRPVASLLVGGDNASFHMNQNIILTSPFHNNYYANEHKIDFVAGLFLGLETPLYSDILGQLGVSYYQNDDYQPAGTVYQFGDPTMGNLSYEYNLQSQRFFLESKLLGTVQEKYHPFLNVGVGRAINAASQYTETPVTSSGVPMSPLFRDKTTSSFAYLVGFGVDVDMEDHIRLGAMYRYVNLGQAKLGTTTTQDSNGYLKNKPFYVNEVLLALSYIG